MNPYLFLKTLALHFIPFSQAVSRKPKHNGRTAGAFGGPQRRKDINNEIRRDYRRLRFSH